MFYHLKYIAKVSDLMTKQNLKNWIYAFISSKIAYHNGFFDRAFKKDHEAPEAYSKFSCKTPDQNQMDSLHHPQFLNLYIGCQFAAELILKSYYLFINLYMVLA